MTTVHQLIVDQTPDREAINRRTIKRMVDGFMRHDLDEIMRLFADDSVYEDILGSGPRGKVYKGKKRIREAFRRQFALLPEHTYEDPIIIVNGDQAHANWTLVMGDARQPDRQYRVRGCDYFELEKGTVTLKSAWLKNHQATRFAVLRLRMRELLTFRKQ